MTHYVAFLRGINLGNRRIKMDKLRNLFKEMGFSNVDSFIASGNVIFSSDMEAMSNLEDQIAGHLESSLGYPVDTFVRTAGQVRKVGSMNLSEEDDVSVYVSFLKEELPDSTAKKLENVRTDVDEFRVIGKEFYWLCRIRSSDSEVWKLPEVKELDLPTSTMRNMTSVRKLIAKHLEKEES